MARRNFQLTPIDDLSIHKDSDANWSDRSYTSRHFASLVCDILLEEQNTTFFLSQLRNTLNWLCVEHNQTFRINNSNCYSIVLLSDYWKITLACLIIIIPLLKFIWAIIKTSDGAQIKKKRFSVAQTHKTRSIDSIYLQLHLIECDFVNHCNQRKSTQIRFDGILIEIVLPTGTTITTLTPGRVLIS